MTRRDELLALAQKFEACVEDARRPEPSPGDPGLFVRPTTAVISLCYAIDAIAAALRALAEQDAGG